MFESGETMSEMSPFSKIIFPIRLYLFSPANKYTHKRQSKDKLTRRWEANLYICFHLL